jgi:hypothetical protein
MASRKASRIPVIVASLVLSCIGGYALRYLPWGGFSQRVEPAVTAEVLLRDLASIPMYQSLKRADPEAYARLASEIAKLVANGGGTKDIAAYAQAYTASFRRSHAEAALAASPEALAALMRTMSDIFDYLYARDEELCGEYALQALGSPRLRALAREEPFSTLIQRHASAVIDTIAEGLKLQGAQDPLAQADIQLAVQGLQARGWSDQMRDDLSDVGRMRTLPAGLVCRMQREWLAVLASLPDPARTRWYREVMGPLLRS